MTAGMATSSPMAVVTSASAIPPATAARPVAPDKKVILAFERTSEDLVITIRDQGRGIDLSGIPNPLAPENLLKTSGRGIFLMRSFMDVVEIRPSQSGTEVK